MEEPVSELLDDYAQFIESSPDHVVDSVLRKPSGGTRTIASGAKGAKARRTAQPSLNPNARSDHDATYLASRHFVAAILAMASGTVFFMAGPSLKISFPAVIAIRAPHGFLSFRDSMTCSFTTPYIAYLGVLSALYIGTLRIRHRVVAGQLPPYPEPTSATNYLSSWEKYTTRVVQAHPRPPAGPHTGARIVHRHRGLGRGRKRKNFVLHVPIHRTDPGLQS